MMVLFLAYVHWFRITFFPNRFVQFFTVLKKIILPIFAVVSFNYQFFLIIFMALICVLEGFLDRQVNLYPLKSRNSLMKALELSTIVVCGAFYAADVHSRTSTAPLVFTYIGTVFVIICILFAYL